MQRNDLISLINDAFNGSERKNQEARWRDIAKFILLERSGNFEGQEIAGGNKTEDVYTSVGAKACRDLAAAIHGTLTNPATAWFGQKFRDEDLNNDSEAPRFLDATNNRLLLRLNESNFPEEVTKVYMHAAALGNGILMQEEKFDEKGRFVGLFFRAVHLSEVAFTENAFGEINRVFVRRKFTVSQLAEMADQMPLALEKLLATDPEELIEIFIALVPSEESKEKEIECIYMLDTGEIIKKMDYYEMPFDVLRWDTKPGELHGSGPGHIAIPEVKLLSELSRLYQEQAIYNVAPSFITTQRNIVGPFQFKPKGVTVVRDIEQLKELVTSPRREIDTRAAMEALTQTIKELFYLDKLMLPPRDKIGEMSAYETAQRVEEMQRVLGPVTGRIERFLQKILIRAFKILLRNNDLPPIPQILRERGIDVEITFLNQLARAQKMENVSALQSWIQDVTMAAQLDPNVVDVVNMDEALRIMARVRGVPEKAIASDEELQAVREQKAQMQQQQMQSDMAVKEADVMAKQAKANKDLV